MLTAKEKENRHNTVNKLQVCANSELSEDVTVNSTILDPFYLSNFRKFVFTEWKDQRFYFGKDIKWFLVILFAL